MLFTVILAALVTITLTQDTSTSTPFSPPWFCHKLECPKFSVMMQTNDFELRHYEPSVWVGTSQSNVDLRNFRNSQMFQKLFHYIDHGNSEGKKIPMTAPVVTQFTPTSANHGNVSMFFMIPFELQANPPTPNATDVYIERAPAMWFYVKSYSGFNLFHQSDKRLAELKQQLGTSLYQYDNNQYFTAGYDSPFSFTNRHNEVWLVAVDRSTAVVGR